MTARTPKETKMRWLLALYLGGLVALAGAVWAADGDPARSGGDANPASYGKGQYTCSEYLLCDGYDDPNSATDTCSDFDIVSAGIGYPDFAVAHLITTTDCAGAVAVMVTGKDSTGGTASDLLSVGLTSAGTSQAVIQPVPNRILAGSTTVGTSCTDVEVILKLCVERRPR
jgi:hypothetical protein